MSAAKKPTVKKTLAQKKSAPVKKVVKKTVVKKAVKTPVKKATQKVAKKKPVAAKKTPVTKKRAATETIRTKKAVPVDLGVVVVPTNIPLRSVEKAEVLRTELSMAWQKSLYSIAYVSGACFILIGATYASSSVFVDSSTIQNSALLAQTSVEDSKSVLQVQNPLPEVMTSQTKILFTLSNVDPASVMYYLVNQETKQVGGSKKVESLLNNKYSLSINPSELESGIYKLQVGYASVGALTLNETRKTEVIGTFIVESQEEIEITNPENTATSSAIEVFSTTISEDSAGEKTIVRDSEDDTEIEQRKLIPLDSPIVTSEADIVTAPPRVTQSSTSVPSILPKTDVFSLYSKNKVVAGLLVINSIQSQELTNLQLYARPSASLNSRFLVKETQRSGARVFVVNTESFLPNGTYEFYAKGTNGVGKEIITRSLVLEVKNELSEAIIIKKQVDSLEEVLEIESDSAPRDFAPINLADTEDRQLDQEVILAGEKLLKDDFVEVNALLKKYATARQSGDLMLLSAAREELDKKKVQLANKALLDRELVGISDDVILDISQRMANLQSRIDTFEQLRTERSAGESSVDSDNDGISDYDEVNLYRTNPNDPDTDGDGFVDGIEIIRGFDPLDATPQVIVNYESPKDSVGLVNEDVLSIKEVVPVVDSLKDTGGPVVFTEIRGKGLPNSFVTLYIYSSPTIVTIKTDADGSFVYTLDKELEDGSHDVFVTLTDNAGSIVAQSKSFSFVKEAQAFTPVDAAAGASVNQETATESALRNSYNTVVGLSVLALGLILIMLGLTLRTKEEDELDVVNKQDNNKKPDPKVEPTKFA
jgi:hypothetical protein